MAAKLTNEQAAALHENGDELTLIDPTTNRVYVVVGQMVFKRAKALLSQQEKDDFAAIQRGIEDMEAGRFSSLEESSERVRNELNARYGS